MKGQRHVRTYRSSQGEASVVEEAARHLEVRPATFVRWSSIAVAKAILEAAKTPRELLAALDCEGVAKGLSASLKCESPR